MYLILNVLGWEYKVNKFPGSGQMQILDRELTDVRNCRPFQGLSRGLGIA
jgi:hypothetical protein